MLKKTYRIIYKRDFDKIFKNGRSSFNNIIGLKILKNKQEFSRFGFIVSKKISKKAVERNSIKRKIREVVKNNIQNIKPGFDCIFIAISGINDKKYQEIEKAVKKHLKKLEAY